MAEYLLANLATNNIVGAYNSEDEALREVLRSLEQYGDAGVRSLALASDSLIGEGAELAGLARRRLSSRNSH